MNGGTYAILAYALSLALLLGYGQAIWLAKARLRRRRP